MTPSVCGITVVAVTLIVTMTGAEGWYGTGRVIVSNLHLNNVTATSMNRWPAPIGWSG
jgi:hypothetical protein